MKKEKLVKLKKYLKECNEDFKTAINELIGEINSKPEEEKEVEIIDQEEIIAEIFEEIEKDNEIEEKILKHIQ